MSLITEKHKALQKEIHARRQEYGAAGHVWAQFVLDVAGSMNTKDVLDYGAGKQGLMKAVPVLDIKSYDPAIDEISNRPAPADLVVCTHVLPYVEKECINAVLKDLKALTKRAVVIAINTHPSGKLLEDGTSVTQIDWSVMAWLATISEFFNLMTFNSTQEGEFVSVWLAK